jgi:hypothetical protein
MLYPSVALSTSTLLAELVQEQSNMEGMGHVVTIKIRDTTIVGCITGTLGISFVTERLQSN